MPSTSLPIVGVNIMVPLNYRADALREVIVSAIQNAFGSDCIIDTPGVIGQDAMVPMQYYNLIDANGSNAQIVVEVQVQSIPNTVYP